MNRKENALIKYEIILVDNNSTDGSRDLFTGWQKDLPFFKYLYQKENYGFGKGNNIGMKVAGGKYFLLLNSDVIVENVNFQDLIDQMEKDGKIGALTVEVKLNENEIDWASHRGFPTIWRSFTYFTKLEKITEKIPVLNKLFGGYHLKDQDLNSIHQIDSPTGAFYLTTKKIMDAIQGFDEQFFMYGEDLDMSYRIKKLGFKIIYYPKYSVLHLKKQSGLDSKEENTKSKTNFYFYDAMKIFYKKNYANNNPGFINKAIYYFIDLKSKL
jgi:GT2 family glycosyltransferase